MGKIDVMEQFYTALRQSGLTPDVFTFNSMLAAYGKALTEPKVLETWQAGAAAGAMPPPQRLAPEPSQAQPHTPRPRPPR